MVFLLFVLLAVGGPGAAQSEAQVDLQDITVQPGDTLSSVSRKYLKDPKKWDEILRYNKLPSAEPTAALPGMTLRIPVASVKEEFQAARLITAVNKVYYRHREGGQWWPATANMAVFRNDSIKTMPESKAVVRFIDNDLMQIDPDSMAIVMPTAKDYSIELKRGGIVAANKRIKMGSAVVAPATADTVYAASVRDDNTTVVQVYKGQAAVAAAGKTVKVDAGKQTEVKVGLAPSLPFEIPDMSGLQSLVAGFASQLSSLKNKLAAAPARAPDPSKMEAPKVSLPAPADDMMKEAASIKLLQPVMGYRIECSKTEDFQYLVAQRYFDDETPMRPEDFGLPAGRYWCRMAPVDLLGTTGKFRDAKVYALGGR